MLQSLAALPFRPLQTHWSLFKNSAGFRGPLFEKAFVHSAHLQKSGSKKCVPCTLALKQKLKEEYQLSWHNLGPADSPLSVSA